MDTGNMVITIFWTVILTAELTLIFTLSCIECDYELWVGNKRSNFSSHINKLIESKADSIIVVDSNKPMPFGVLYFKPYGQEK